MNTKFIGLDGFDEIECLKSSSKRAKRKKELNTAQKTVRFVKRAVKLCKPKKTATVLKAQSAKTVKAVDKKSQSGMLDKFYNENRQGQNSEFNNSAKESITSVVCVNNRKYAHSAPNNGYRTHALLKKRAVLAVVAFLAAIMIPCVTVASALDTPDTFNTQPSDKVLKAESTNVPENDFLIAATSDEVQNSDIINPELFVESGVVGLYIDGELIGATTQAAELNEALNKVLVDYRKDYDAETTTEFANDVKIKNGSFDETQINTVDEIMAKADGKFSIALSTDMYYTTDIAYDTETEYDDSEYSSYEEVKTEGEDGEEKVMIRVTFTDGIQTDVYVTGSKVTKEPVDRVIIKGSKDGEYEPGNTSAGTASGQFIWPLPYTHSVSSLFEWRWGRMHQGIDIADGGVYGQPIVAADGGTVTFAGGDNSGYGNYVVIDHGNGYQTLYGHASSLAVSTGQYVSQGETIAYVGSTGNSTGPHLHFEIIENGEKINPLNYVC